MSLKQHIMHCLVRAFPKEALLPEGRSEKTLNEVPRAVCCRNKSVLPHGNSDAPWRGRLLEAAGEAAGDAIVVLEVTILGPVPGVAVQIEAHIGQFQANLQIFVDLVAVDEVHLQAESVVVR